MAGIGFELKKLFRKRNITGMLAGLIHSVFVTAGHMLLMMAFLVAIQVYLLNKGTGQFERELFSSAILYSFIFPFILTSGVNMILSRYIADSLYTGNADRILPSMYGSMAVMILFTGIPGALFYIFSPVDLWFRLAAFILYMEVGILFHITVYVSAIKKYDRITFSYIFGVMAAAVPSYFILESDMPPMMMVTGLVLSVAAGVLIIICGIVYGIRKYFSLVSNNYFDFLLYFKKYPQLYFLNTIYAVGLFVHNFVFWAYPATRDSVAQTYVFSSDYDMASFLGMLTVIPAMVVFVVRMETSFYLRYKAYLDATNGGTGEDIAVARHNLIRSVWQETAYMIEVQVIASLIMIALIQNIMPGLGISKPILDFFPFVAYGFYFTVMMNMIGTILLYFVRQRELIKVYALFFLANAVFTIVSVYLGEAFYGIGIIMAGMAGFAVVIARLRDTMKQLDYIIFCSIVLEPEEKRTAFDRFTAGLDAKTDRVKDNNRKKIKKKDINEKNISAKTTESGHKL